MSSPTVTHSPLEDAVLTLLGEQGLEAEEVTEPGAAGPDWGKLEKLEKETKQSAPKPATRGQAFHFARRRSADELPWVDLLDGNLPSP